ncbi:hypothetical protein K439DRAFT_1625632 [Ramaria rubella]|nr:hypothetical protein K439DRAFT_1625632 [Ramaria rubella]
MEFTKAVKSYNNQLPKWEKTHGEAFHAAAASKSQTRHKSLAGEDVVFLNLTAAIKIYVQHVIMAAEMEHARDLMTEYLLQYKKIYGEGKLKPNHHFAVHLGDHIQDYRPIHEF